MAIAYFIPDQVKLLAASSANSGSHTHPNNSGGGGGGVHVNTNSSTPPQTPPPTHHTAGNHSNNNFRANITIPLSAYSSNNNNSSAAQADAGCWDLLTQIFCHALRFCHQSERSPTTTVIQISLEISQSEASAGGDTFVQVGAAAVPVTPQQCHCQHQQQQPTAIVQPLNSTTQTTQHMSAANVPQSSTVSSETAAAAAIVGSGTLEPATHKPKPKAKKK